MRGRGERQGSCAVPQRVTAVGEVGLNLQLALCVICVTSGNVLEVKVTRVLAWCLPTPWPSHHFTLTATVRYYNCLILESRKPIGKTNKQTKQIKKKKTTTLTYSHKAYFMADPRCVPRWVAGHAMTTCQASGYPLFQHLRLHRVPVAGRVWISN